MLLAISRLPLQSIDSEFELLQTIFASTYFRRLGCIQCVLCLDLQALSSKMGAVSGLLRLPEDACEYV